MRLLRQLETLAVAEQVALALGELGIESDVSQGKDGLYALWVVDEEKLPRAQELTQHWLDGGAEAELARFAEHGLRRKREAAQLDEERARVAERLHQRLLAATRPGSTRLSWGIVALCVGIFLLSSSFGLESTLSVLAIADPYEPLSPTRVEVFGLSLHWLPLPWHEPWRLLTPILVHQDIFHLLFNMLLMIQPGLGRMLELRHGSRTLLLLTLVSGAISNVAQYELSGSPAFSGFSGVVYALLGFLWMRGRYDPSAGYRLTNGAVGFMLLWLAWGFLGRFANMHIANWCHLFGLLVGMAWGILSSRIRV